MFEAVRKGKGGDLYDRIGQFLRTQGLAPDPANYALAHAALADPNGALAGAVARLTEGGVRLNSRDLAALGGVAGGGAGGGAAAAVDAAPEAEARADALVAQTQAQVDGLATIMATVQAETQGFGRDLAASAAAMHHEPGRPARSGEEIARIATKMVARIRDAETRLAAATQETDALRASLAEARDTARRDELTGLPNRRAFDEAFAARDERQGPYCLAICDVDHFKRLNDSHGHPVGDRVLRALAQTLAASCEGHLVVRYGGEEFAVLTRGLAPAAAGELLDRARAEVSAKRFRVRDTDAGIGQVSFSAGLTAIARGEGKASAFERADQLLYAAKAQGRDQVCAG